jgi:hypothetical protein
MRVADAAASAVRLRGSEVPRRGSR